VLRPVVRRVDITIHKHTSNGQRDDESNLDTRSKSILDGMVGLGWLVDDSPKWLEWGGVVEGERSPDGPQTVITITENEEP
jgi:hypothetical protein